MMIRVIFIYCTFLPVSQYYDIVFGNFKQALN